MFAKHTHGLPGTPKKLQVSIEKNQKAVRISNRLIAFISPPNSKSGSFRLSVLSSRFNTMNTNYKMHIHF
jgi:hypothetical protein